VGQTMAGEMISVSEIEVVMMYIWRRYVGQ
jgi:hypothetical protein